MSHASHCLTYSSAYGLKHRADGLSGQWGHSKMIPKAHMIYLILISSSEREIVLWPLCSLPRTITRCSLVALFQAFHIPSLPQPLQRLQKLIDITFISQRTNINPEKSKGPTQGNMAENGKARIQTQVLFDSN